MLRRELILLLVIQGAVAVFFFGVEVRTGRAEYLQGEEPLLIIRNHGPYTVSFGSYYRLERHRDGEWVRVPFRENVAFPALESVLEPGDRSRQRIRFGGLTEVPGEGRYRIEKKFSVEDVDKDFTKYAEFYIRSSLSYGMVWGRFRLHIGITVFALMAISILFVMRKTRMGTM
jgi:hypothetical protein